MTQINKDNELPVSTLRDLISYDPETGKLTWLERTKETLYNDANRNSFNTKFAGREALACLNEVGYLRGTIYGTHQFAHRVAWALHTGEWPTAYLDHINGDPTDNRIENLREVSHQGNMRKQKNNTSGVVGVSYDKSTWRWRAKIKIDGKTHELGSFMHLEDAAQARLAAEIKYGYHENHGRG